MTQLQLNALPQTWRCAGEIWTSDTYHLNIFKFSTLNIENRMVEVTLPKKSIRFSLDDMIEARTFRLPARSLTMIFTLDEQTALVSLFRLPRPAIDHFLSESDLSITQQRTWRTGLEAGRDKKRYGLQ